MTRSIGYIGALAIPGIPDVATHTFRGFILLKLTLWISTLAHRVFNKDKYLGRQDSVEAHQPQPMKGSRERQEEQEGAGEAGQDWEDELLDRVRNILDGG